MWCIPKLTPEYIQHMEDVLDLYEKPYDPLEPVLCFDEKSKELREDTRKTKPAKRGKVRRRDYEYKRNGTANIFLAVEPKGGYRRGEVTKRRTKSDFAKEIKRLIDLPRYKTAQTIHFVLDNLNTHCEKSFIETFGMEKTRRIFSRIQFHHTPKHASWLNMAEIEIGVMDRQAIRGRIPTSEKLRTQLFAWQKRRNRQCAAIDWTFTTTKARKKFRYSGRKLI